MEHNRQALGIGSKLLVLSGSVLILVAVTVLSLTGVFVYQLFYEPENVRLVQFLMENLKVSDRAFFGHVGGSDFYINMADQVKYFLYLFVTIIIVSILVSMFRGILSAGVALIKLANGHKGDKEHAVSKAG